MNTKNQLIGVLWKKFTCEILAWVIVSMIKSVILVSIQIVEHAKSMS